MSFLKNHRPFARGAMAVVPSHCGLRVDPVFRGQARQMRGSCSALGHPLPTGDRAPLRGQPCAMGTVGDGPLSLCAHLTLPSRGDAARPCQGGAQPRAVRASSASPTPACGWAPEAHAWEQGHNWGMPGRCLAIGIWDDLGQVPLHH